MSPYNLSISAEISLTPGSLCGMLTTRKEHNTMLLPIGTRFLAALEERTLLSKHNAYSGL